MNNATGLTRAPFGPWCVDLTTSTALRTLDQLQTDALDDILLSRIARNVFREPRARPNRAARRATGR